MPNKNREANRFVLTTREFDDLVEQVVRRRLASPEFATVAAVKAEADAIGARIEALPARRRAGRPATVREIARLVSDLYRHQRIAHQVLRQALLRARA